MYGQATLDITGQQICCHILLFLFKQSQVAIDIEQPLVPCVFICPPRKCQSGPKRVGGRRWVVTEARCGGSMLAMKLPPPWSYKQFVTQENHAIILSIYPKRYFEYESNRWACGGGRGDWIVEMEVRVWQRTTLVLQPLRHIQIHTTHHITILSSTDTFKSQAVVFELPRNATYLNQDLFSWKHHQNYNIIIFQLYN